jgi:hypothetical protein
MSGFAVMLSAGVHAVMYIRAFNDATGRVGLESFLTMSLSAPCPRPLYAGFSCGGIVKQEALFVCA